MARTINGNLTGKAAHHDSELESTNFLSERELLEVAVKSAESLLNGARGFTDTTRFEQRLQDAKEALELYDNAQWLAVGELPTDSRTVAELDLDLWQEETEETRRSDYPM